MNARAVSARTAPNFAQKSSSMPNDANCSKRSRKRVSRGGAVSGEKYSFGVGSNVSTSEEPSQIPRRSACALEDRAMTDVQTVENADGDRAWPRRAATAAAAKRTSDTAAYNPYATD